jgi:hypothetical protein
MDPRTPQKVDVLELYDVAVRDYITITIEDKVIPTVMGTAQAIHGSAKSRLGALRRNSRIPIPSTSLVRTGIPIDTSRAISTMRMRVNYLDASKSHAMMAVPPQPTQAVYNLSALFADPEQMNEFHQAYINKFKQYVHTLYILIPEYSTSDGGMSFKLKTSDLKEDSTVNTVSRDRAFELTGTLTLDTFNFHEVEVVPTIGDVVSIFEEY